MPAIAQHETFCICGVQIEVGEVILMVQDSAVHAHCQQRAAQRDRADQQMNLWRTDFLFNEAQIKAVTRAEEITSADHISFDGETVLAIDIPRLAGQVAKVYELMRDGQFRTLGEIAHECKCLETSAGARLRDLRKERFGAHVVESRRVSGTALLYEYRLILSIGPPTQHNEHRQAAA